MLRQPNILGIRAASRKGLPNCRAGWEVWGGRARSSAVELENSHVQIISAFLPLRSVKPLGIRCLPAPRLPLTLPVFKPASALSLSPTLSAQPRLLGSGSQTHDSYLLLFSPGDVLVLYFWGLQGWRCKWCSTPL